MAFFLQRISIRIGRTVNFYFSSLDLHILAEGMETKEQADYLLSSGCTFAQGYLYGKPMPAEEFLQKY